MELVDLVVIGAGWYGLHAAKTYRQIHPLRCVVVLEQTSSLGGVWAHHRFSPGLYTPHRVGNYEYADFPLDPTEFGLVAGQRIPGDMIHKYLEGYVDRFHLRENIWFDSRVVKVEESDGVWTVTIVGSGGGGSSSGGSTSTGGTSGSGRAKTQTLQTSKLIVATGSLDPGDAPVFPGREKFGGPILHTQDLGDEAEKIIQAGGEAITVVGSSWGAQEIVSLCASAGRMVDWVVPHEEGQNLAMALSETSQKLENLVSTRWLSLFNPDLYTHFDARKGDWIDSLRRFMHRSWVGRKTTQSVWGFINRQIRQSPGINIPGLQNAYNQLDAYRMGIPDANPELCELIREGRVRIHVAVVQHLSHRNVHLSTGHVLGAAAVLYAAGPPSSTIRFLPRGVITNTTDGGSEREFAQAARQELLRHWPQLGNNTDATALGDEPMIKDAWLTRWMVPPALVQARSIVFLGAVMPTHAPVVASVQALWAAVYLGGEVDLAPICPDWQCPDSLRASVTGTSITTGTGTGTGTSVTTGTGTTGDKQGTEDVFWEAALHREYGRLRYGYGTTLGSERRLQYEALAYVDQLVRDLGLEQRRKKGCWAELWQAYRASDYQGLAGEWKASTTSSREPSQLSGSKDIQG